MKTYSAKLEDGRSVEVQAENAKSAREAAEEVYDLRALSVVEILADEDEDEDASEEDADPEE